MGVADTFNNDLLIKQFNEVWNKSLESICADVKQGKPSGIYQWQQKLLAPAPKFREEAKSIVSSLEYTRDKHIFKNKADRELLIGIYYYAQGDHQKALARFNLIQKHCIEAITYIACIVKSTDPTLALELFKMAASQGSAQASFHLGSHYNDHYNKTMQAWTKANAFAHLKKSADANHPDALLHLSDFYYSGIPFDMKSTLRCLRKAAAQGNCDALLKLGEIYRQHDKLASQQDVFKIFACGAENNLPKFYIPYGEMYELGHATEMDCGKAMAWYRRAHENQVPNAILKSGELMKKYAEHPHVVFHSAFIFKDDPEVINKFNTLPLQHPQVFYELVNHEPWENLKPLLSKDNSASVYNTTMAKQDFNLKLLTVYDILFDAYLKELENNQEIDAPKTRKLINFTKTLINEILKCKAETNYDRAYIHQMLNEFEAEWKNLSPQENMNIFKKPELELEKALKQASDELRKIMFQSNLNSNRP